MDFEFRRYLHEVVAGGVKTVLTPSSWDDNGWKISFDAALFLGGEERRLGRLRILRLGQQQSVVPATFERLPDSFVSLGASPTYYEQLAKLDRTLARGILIGLRDIAFDQTLREAAETDAGFGEALLRTQGARLGLRTAQALFHGQVAVDADDLGFSFSTDVGERRSEVRFELNRRRPLGRIAGIIGPNGTGKTRILSRLAYALLGYVNRVEHEVLTPAPLLPGGVIAVSWSAFDRFRVPIGAHSLSERYLYIGLRRFDVPRKAKFVPRMDLDPDGNRHERLDASHAVKQAWNDFEKMNDRRRGSLRRRLANLTAFESASLDALPNLTTPALFGGWLRSHSSGQQIVVFTLLHLEAHLEPGTMLLFDEPESHLHPRLLSSLLREIHDLLTARDSVAIIATHNPLVLQELPARQVAFLRAGGTEAYEGETFGETLSRLSELAFGVGGEARNWRTIVREHQEAGTLGELRSVLAEGLNLTLEGLFDEDAR